MAEPFLGQIKIFAFNRIPRGWLNCDGQLLQIRAFSALFSLIGITYGGDGKTTFAVPDLRGRVAVAAASASKSSTYYLGASGGVESVALSMTATPSHTHSVNVNTSEGTLTNVRGAIYAAVPAAANTNLYAPFSTPFAIDASMLANAGGGAGHNNMQPYLALTYAIACMGVYPSRP